MEIVILLLIVLILLIGVGFKYILERLDYLDKRDPFFDEFKRQERRARKTKPNKKLSHYIPSKDLDAKMRGKIVDFYDG